MSCRQVAEERRMKKMQVKIAAPINPSHVFFGDKDRKGTFFNFLPKVIPHMYAKTSFAATAVIGKKNQKIPCKEHVAKNFVCISTIASVTSVHTI
jgi:hypothetical protein